MAHGTLSALTHTLSHAIPEDHALAQLTGERNYDCLQCTGCNTLPIYAPRITDLVEFTGSSCGFGVWSSRSTSPPRRYSGLAGPARRSPSPSLPFSPTPPFPLPPSPSARTLLQALPPRAIRAARPLPSNHFLMTHSSPPSFVSFPSVDYYVPLRRSSSLLRPPLHWCSASAAGSPGNERVIEVLALGLVNPRFNTCGSPALPARPPART